VDTPNPAALKFVVSKCWLKNVEFKNIDQTGASPLAKELFKFPYVKEILSMKITSLSQNMKLMIGKK
jgi:hypothetical protein